MIPERYRHSNYMDLPETIRQKFESMRETRRGMYIHGGVGTGKTHTMYALIRHVFGNPIVWNTTELMHEIKVDFDRPYGEKANPESEILRSRKLLFLDDMGAEKMSEFVAEKFYLIINDRYEKNIPIIVTSNLSIAELADRVGDRIASRIVEMCDVIELSGKDRRMDKSSKTKL